MAVSWSPPSNAESAALEFYHVILYTESSMIHLAILTPMNSRYNAMLPSSQEIYNASITAENKCGQMSERITAACINSTTSAGPGVYLNIKVIIIVCMQSCVYMYLL